MSTLQCDFGLESLAGGTVDVSTLDALENVDFEKLVQQLKSSYPAHFLEGRRGKKSEFGGAKNRRGQTFRRCLLLTGEAGRLTTLAFLSSIRVKPSSKVQGSYELVSGEGFSLY